MRKKSPKSSKFLADAGSNTGSEQKPVQPETAKPGFTPIASLFDTFQLEDKGGYISQEFQDFGYRLAVELKDLTHKSLYMKLAKTVDRLLLEKALSFVKDAPNVKSKARLFMWRLKQLRAEKLEKQSIKQ